MTLQDCRGPTTLHFQRINKMKMQPKSRGGNHRQLVSLSLVPSVFSVGLGLEINHVISLKTAPSHTFWIVPGAFAKEQFLCIT